MKTTKKETAQKPATNPSRGYPVYRPTVSKILDCGECGTKYIKTRPRQGTCIKCMVKAADAKAKR